MKYAVHYIHPAIQQVVSNGLDYEAALGLAVEMNASLNRDLKMQASAVKLESDDEFSGMFVIKPV